MAAAAATLMQARQTVLPKRLGAPGPDEAQLLAIVGAAAHAPDHGQLLPWRLVRVLPAQRPLLADAFAAALHERDPQAGAELLEQAREKAYRAPELWVLVVDGAKGDADIGLHERILSAGCAVQNVLLMATALAATNLIANKPVHPPPRKGCAVRPLRGSFGQVSWRGPGWGARSCQ